MNLSQKIKFSEKILCFIVFCVVLSFGMKGKTAGDLVYSLQEGKDTTITVDGGNICVSFKAAKSTGYGISLEFPEKMDELYSFRWYFDEIKQDKAHGIWEGNTFHIYSTFKAGKRYHLRMEYTLYGSLTKMDVKCVYQKVGKIGDVGLHVSSSFDRTSGTLTLRGSGSTWDYLVLDVGKKWPYEKIRRIVVGEGITRLGRGIFSNQYYVRSVKLPSTLKIIDYNAFTLMNYHNNNPKNARKTPKKGALKKIKLPSGLEIINCGFEGFFPKGANAIKELILPDTLKNWNGGFAGYQTVYMPAGVKPCKSYPGQSQTDFFYECLRQATPGAVFYGYKGSALEKAIAKTNKYRKLKGNNKLRFINVAKDPQLRASVKQQTITLTWSRDLAATKYRVYRVLNGKLKSVATTTDTKVVLKNLLSNKEYSYVVKPLFYTAEGSCIKGRGSKKMVTVKTKPKPLAVGKTFTVDYLRYKVTKSKWKASEVTFIGTYNSTLEEINIPSTVRDKNGITYRVTAIGASALRSNKRVKSVVIGSKCQKIQSRAFMNCSNLRQIRFRSKNMKAINKNAFKNIYDKAIFRCPKGKVAAYKKLLTPKTGFKNTMKVKRYVKTS